MIHALDTINHPGNQLAPTATVPAHDWPEFMELSHAQRETIQDMIRAMRVLEATPRGKIVNTCAMLAAQSDQRGFSKQNLYKIYKLWTNGGRKTDPQGHPNGPTFEPGDWRMLVPNYHNGSSGLPKEFIRHLVAEYSKTTREKDAWRAVCRRLALDWLGGAAIPGYPPAHEWYRLNGLPMPDRQLVRPQDLPQGWSPSNLWRAAKRALPRKSMRRAAQGQVNRMATNWAAQLLRDRSKLKPLELWTIDDVRLDLQARMFVDGRWQIVYVDALFALDVATGMVLGFGLKGQATRGEDTEAGRAAGTKMSIDGRDVRCLLLDILQRFGLPPYLSRLLCENATAKLSNADEAAFLAMLPNRLEIDYTGMGHGQLLKSGFAEDWGRPGLKGWIESWFRLLHTSINHLPGTTGRRYELTRGDHAGRIKYATTLVQRAEKLIQGPLTPDHPLSEQLIFPVLTVEEVYRVVAEMVQALNWRVDHRLQGFERIFEWRDEQGRWRPERDLDMLRPADRAGKELTARMEAPCERMQRLIRPHATGFQPLDPCVLAALYEEKRHVTARGGRVRINDQRLGTDSMLFAADHLHALDEYEGRKDALLAYVPADAAHIVLADAATGAHVATLRREGRVDITDDEAIGKRAGEVRRAQDAELGHLHTYLASEEDRFVEMRATNDRLLSTPEPVRSPMAEQIQRAAAKGRRERNNDRQLHRMGDTSILAETPDREIPEDDDDQLNPDDLY